MNKFVQKVIDLATAEVNYVEKETYDQLDDPSANAGDENYTKYQRDLAKVSYFNSSKKGVAWCAVFWNWLFFTIFGEDLAKKMLCQPNSGNAAAGCTSAMNYFKDKNRFFDKPEAGDIIFFWDSEKKESSHSGFVYKTSLLYVYTIEGNTSSASGVVENGGAVAKKKYRLNHERIIGYGRPRWEYVTEVPDIELPEQNATTEESAENEPNAYVHVTKGSTVNYRTKPNITAKQVSGMPRIKKGERVYMKTTDGTWAAVEYKGYRGYVMREFLKLIDETAEEQPDTQEKEQEQEEQLTYTTVQGDTLWKIASIYLGSGLKYKEIMKANGMRNTIVRPGMVLKIPK